MLITVGVERVKSVILASFNKSANRANFVIN